MTEATSPPTSARGGAAGSPSVDGASISDAVRSGLEVLAATARHIARLETSAGDDLRRASQLVLERTGGDRRGHVVVTGLGKSGLIGAKLAATLASTGTVAHFVHGADALHGDAGMVTPDDVVLALSNSGRTSEVVAFAELVRARGVPVVALTGCGGDSPLAALAEVTLDARVPAECDPYDLVPTASTSVCLALGDALAVTLMVARGFGPEDFGRFHPGGSLGSRLGGEQRS